MPAGLDDRLEKPVVLPPLAWKYAGDATYKSAVSLASPFTMLRFHSPAYGRLSESDLSDTPSFVFDLHTVGGQTPAPL